MENNPALVDEVDRLSRLLRAEDDALRLLDRIEQLGYLRAGRTEREVEKDIYALAKLEFGVHKHWHKRIVRAGKNALAIAEDNPPVLTIEDDDLVFLDLGPVFGEWEADVGRSYTIGQNPRKVALCRDLLSQFDLVKDRFIQDQNITGEALYEFACESAQAAGWRFGGKMAGHVIGEFPHARLPGAKQFNHISPENPNRLRDPDGNGRARHWVLEIHLVDPLAGFGGFYERLMLEPGALLS